MESNKICIWFLYYSEENVKSINYENIDIESSLYIRQKLCSSAPYFAFGKLLCDDFPAISTGFVGILEFLTNNKRKLMDKLQDEEQRIYINKLTNIDDFSIIHHVAIIKCLMKLYVCLLAPYERINQALEAIDITGIMENVASVVTYRHNYRFLLIWLRTAAITGILKLRNQSKKMTESQAVMLVDNSPVGSLILYAMMSYVQTKLIKYTVRLPDIDSLSIDGLLNSDLSLEHSNTVVTMFADICDNRDILPLHTDGLNSRSTDNVPTTLTIALVFHWIIGNSLRKLGNLLHTSMSPQTTPERTTNHRPHSLPLNNNFPDTNESRPFFINSNNKSTNDGLRQLFCKEKDDRNRPNVDGDTSSDIFLTPTDDESVAPYDKPMSPPLKILQYKTVDNILKPTNLKAEFQKRLKEKQCLQRLPQKTNVIVSNETTWLAQRNKTEVIHMPVTPKKSFKSSENLLNNGSPQKNLSQTQLNQIQLQLSLRRQKIENDKKTITEQTEKCLEDSKQKAFFQAIDKEKKLIRRRSMEISKDSLNNADRAEADKRLSMYLKRTSENVVLSPVRRLGSRERLQAFADAHNRSVSDTVETTDLADGNNVMEPPQSSQASDTALPSLHICLDQTNELPTSDPHYGTNEETNAILLNEHFENISRKNSSPSISSLSSYGNPCSDKNLVSKEDYKKSFEMLSSSVTSLQEEIRLLKKQQDSWNNQASNPRNKVENDHKPNNIARSENNSVVETPTNNGFSLTEITDLPKFVLDINTEEEKSPEPLLFEESKQLNSILPISEELPKDNGLSMKSDNKLEPVYSVSPCSQTSSSRIANQIVPMKEISGDLSLEKTESNCCGIENNELFTVSIIRSVTEDDVTCSSESHKVTNVQPVSFVIADDQNNANVNGQNQDMIAKREEIRLMKMEHFKQKREHDRDARLIVVNEELSERESKKLVDHDTIDCFSKKDEEISSGPVAVESKPIPAGKTVKKSQTPRSNIRNVKQESVENLSMASLRKNNWFPPIRQSQRMTSNSTSKLNTTASQMLGINSVAPEYQGPKLFAKRKVKTNRSVIANAISYCCLAGSVNTVAKDIVLKDLAESDGTHFMILFRDSRCQYKSLYFLDLTTDELIFITGNGPKKITHEMVEKFFKYNSGTKQFNAISSTKHLSTAVDAVCIQSSHWNIRPTGQIITGAVSTSSIVSQIKTKRPS